MKNMPQNNHASRFAAPLTLIGLSVLYALYLPPDTSLVQFGFVLLSTTALSTFAWQLHHQLIILSGTIGLYELMTIAVGFDILNTVVLCCAGLILYFYIALEQSGPQSP